MFRRLKASLIGSGKRDEGIPAGNPHRHLLEAQIREKLLRGRSVGEVHEWALGWNVKEGEPLKREEVAALIGEVSRSVDGATRPTPPVSTITDLAELRPVWDLEHRVEWLVEDLLPTGMVTLVTAESGTGKTWVAHAISGAVAHGNPFAGFPTKQTRVLYIDGENPLSVVKRNLAALGVARADGLQIWGGWVDSPPPHPSSPIVVQFAREGKGLIVYDPLVAFMQGDENVSRDTRRFMDQFRALANQGATVLLLHHTGKAESSKEYRGSSDFKGSVDMAYNLSTLEQKDGKIHRLFLKCFKGRIAPGPNVNLEFEEGEGFSSAQKADQSSDLTWGPRPSKSPEERVQQIVKERPGSNQGEIIAAAKGGGISKGQVLKVLKDDAVFDCKRGTGSTKALSPPGGARGSGYDYGIGGPDHAELNR